MLIKKFFITFLLLFSISSYAKNIDIINKIQFKGLKHVSQNEALTSIVFHTGKEISKRDIQNSIYALFKTGKFEDIKVIYSNKNIIFYIKEKPIISDIIFSGNTLIKNSMLDSYLKKINITKGSLFNEFFVNILIKTIEDFYYNIGRFKSHVTVLKNISKDNTVDLKIEINEGVQTNINSIKILGIKDFSKEKILSLFQSKDHPIWWNFLDKCIYSPQKLNEDLKNLNNFYLNQGYFYFHIINKTIDFIKEKNEVNITINVSEGEKYRISKFFVNGNVFPYHLSITKLININNDELYNKDKINNIIHNIIRFLSKNGYIDATVAVDSKIDYNTKTIVLDFNIDIKKRFFVHRINFIGNSITQDKVLRREIQQSEGKYINTDLIILGKKSLENTKYIKNVEIIQKRRSDPLNQVDIFYRVTEQALGSINFGLGYGMDNGISFNTSVSKDNIFGSGNSIKANIIKNDNQKYADISINYPYFIFNIQDLNTRFFYNDLKYNFNNIDDVFKKTYGLEGSLGIKINDFNKINFGFGYTHNDVNNKEKKIDFPHIHKKSLDSIFLKNSIVNDFTVNYSWIHSTLEHLYFPVSGNHTYISGKNTIPGSDNNFYKFILDSENYLPIDKKKNFIFLNHVHFGIGNIFNKEQFPFYENFYSNSENNIRGFRVNTIGPKRIYDLSDSKKCIGYFNNNRCESIDSIGGNITFTSNLEMIAPIPFIDSNYSKFFRTSVFFDIGNIWDTKLYNYKEDHILSYFKNNIFNDLYSSMGLSLQWLSPIGPLVFSYAFPIKKDKGYQLEPFQFNFRKNW